MNITRPESSKSISTPVNKSVLEKIIFSINFFTKSTFTPYFIINYFSFANAPKTTIILSLVPDCVLPSLFSGK